MRQQNKMPPFSTRVCYVPPRKPWLVPLPVICPVGKFISCSGRTHGQGHHCPKKRLFPVQLNSVGTSFPWIANQILLACTEVFHSCIYDSGAAQMHTGFFFFHHTVFLPIFQFPLSTTLLFLSRTIPSQSS